MTTQYQMRFPFTTKQEIIDWETYYKHQQSKKAQYTEQTVIDLKEQVKARENTENPKGYLRQSELRTMAKWKSHYVPSKIDKNKQSLIEDATSKAFRLDDDWVKLQELKRINGVSESVASVILHLYDQEKYPILDKHALRSIGIDNRQVYYDEPFWLKYTNLCRSASDRFGVSMRSLDRALYKFSQSGAAEAIKITSDKTLAFELKLRGYEVTKL